MMTTPLDDLPPPDDLDAPRDAANPLVDVELERAILGQCLAFEKVCALYQAEGVTRDDFYRDAHRAVFAAMLPVDRSAIDVDIVSVGRELRAREQFAEVGHAYFATLIDGVPRPSTATVSAHALTLRTLAKLRRAEAASRKLISELQSNRDARTLDHVSQHLTEVEHSLLDDRLQGSSTLDATAQLFALRDDIALDDRGKLYLGFPYLDFVIDGLRAGEVCGVMARPGIGKTLLFCHVLQALSPLPCAMFSLEMPAAQITERLAQQLYRSDRKTLRGAMKLDAFEPERYLDRFRHFTLIDASGLDVPEMSARLRRHALAADASDPLRCVIVDHLGLIGGDTKLSTYDRVSKQARELKELAKRHHVAVIVAIQVSREAGGDGSKRLSLGSARDSGVVEEAVDYLLGMRRLDYSPTIPAEQQEQYRDMLFVEVVKNRHGRHAPREVAIRIDPVSLELREDEDVRVDENDIARIARTRR